MRQRLIARMDPLLDSSVCSLDGNFNDFNTDLNGQLVIVLSYQSELVASPQ